MGYEIDFIGVGQESKSGDAIAIRWGNLLGPREQQSVVLIDGGFRESGHDISRTYLKIEIEAELSYSYCDGEVDRRAMGTNSGALS